MPETAVDIQFIKAKMKEAWSAGDFGVIAKIIEHEGVSFIKRLNIKKGSELLDVACGTGNLSIPAAKSGAQVTGLDLVADLIEQAKERAANEDLRIRFVVGDAENLPFEDNEFDYVVSMFGAMFAPRPDVTAKELFRVCKPEGIVAMANWTMEGFVGDLFRINAKYAPMPPGIENPALWGSENVIRERFSQYASDIQTTRRMLREYLLMSPAEVVEHFRIYFGPSQKTFDMLNDEDRRKFRNENTELWEKYNLSKDGATMVDAEYLEVIAVKK